MANRSVVRCAFRDNGRDASGARLAAMPARWLLALLVTFALAHSRAVAAPVDDADSPAGVIDRPARAWTFDRWLRTEPLTLERLRGKVVLVRWFTEGCHYCESTLPAIEALRQRYGAQGLVVVGVYHPKPPRHVSSRQIEALATRLGFTGPLAVDERWSTLERWWLQGHPERNWTSVSFLIDRDGVVRWAHPGGEYHPSRDPRHARCDASHAQLDRVIRKALGESRAAR